MNFNFCTFAGNVAAYGSALSVGGGSYADLHGSIVWGNQGQNSLAAVQWDNNGSSLYLSEYSSRWTKWSFCRYTIICTIL